MAKDFDKALGYAFLLLKYRARSKKEIIDRLKRKGYPPSSTDKVIAYLQEYNYLNDEEFARMFVSSSLEKGWGPRRIKFEFKKLGVGPKIFERFLATRDFKDKKKEKIHQLIERKIQFYKGKKNSTQKIIRFLVGKGFEYDEIFKALDELGVKRF
ncbi:MAG: regulatory protein RecX [Candidatus Omnitrophota bacterium]|nr:MAG: regulatory protein RecX [Candidatus Omnitrophota bacterium]